MGKYLRLVVDKYEAFDKENETMDLNQGYTDFFKIERKFLLEGNQSDIENFISSLEPEQVRPLAQLIMYDGLINQNKDLLQNAKFIFEWNMKKTGAYSFEDFDYLSKIDRNL